MIVSLFVYLSKYICKVVRPKTLLEAVLMYIIRENEDNRFNFPEPRKTRRRDSNTIEEAHRNPATTRQANKFLDKA